MDLGPTWTLQKSSRRRGRKGKGPYIGVRLKGGRWVSEIRIPKTNTRIWLGTHHSAEKAARAYDAALYCLKGEQGLFNFPNNRWPDLDNRSVGSLAVDEIQGIAAEFACLDEFGATAEEPFVMSPLRAADMQQLETLDLPDPKNTSEMGGGNEVDGEQHASTCVPEELEQEPYIPTYAPEEEQPYVPAYDPEAVAGTMPHGNLQLDEWLLLGGDWMGKFH